MATAGLMYPPGGVEQGPESPGKARVAVPTGTESGTLSAPAPTVADPESDPDLAELVARWLALPEAVRQSILGLVRGAVADGQ